MALNCSFFFESQKKRLRLFNLQIFIMVDHRPKYFPVYQWPVFNDHFMPHQHVLPGNIQLWGKPCFYMFNKKGCHFGRPGGPGFCHQVVGLWHGDRSCLYCHMDHVPSPDRWTGPESCYCNWRALFCWRQPTSHGSLANHPLQKKTACKDMTCFAMIAMIGVSFAFTVCPALGEAEERATAQVRSAGVPWDRTSGTALRG